MTTFGDALKKFRASVYKHGDLWQCSVICAFEGQRRVAFKEAQAILNASSLSIAKVSHTGMTIQVERGGVLRFHGPDSRLEGFNVPHMVVLFQPDAETESDLRAYNRSSFIEPEDLVFQVASL